MPNFSMRPRSREKGRSDRISARVSDCVIAAGMDPSSEYLSVYLSPSVIASTVVWSKLRVQIDMTRGARESAGDKSTSLSSSTHDSVFLIMFFGAHAGSEPRFSIRRLVHSTKNGALSSSPPRGGRCSIRRSSTSTLTTCDACGLGYRRKNA